jgi:hypothetical protein
MYVAGNNKTYLRLRAKYLIFFIDLNLICGFSIDFHQESQLDICSVEATMIHEYRQTDMELIIYASVSKKE